MLKGGGFRVCWDPSRGRGGVASTSTQFHGGYGCDAVPGFHPSGGTPFSSQGSWMKAKNMLKWIRNHRRPIRAALVLVALLSFAGPWMYEQIMVPSQYPCSPPSIRLEGEFCGYPIYGIQIIGWIFIGSLQTAASYALGAGEVPQLGPILLVNAFGLAVLAPLIVMSLSLLLGREWSSPVLRYATWALATSAALAYGLSNYPTVHLGQWGSWLYTFTAGLSLILEVTTRST